MSTETNSHHRWPVLLMAWSVFVAEARAFSGGAGDPNDPYQIASAEQLVTIGSDPNLLSRHFVLVADIDLDPNLGGGHVFTHAVIASGTNDESGSQGTSFDGSFNGGGYTIRNLVIRAPGGRSIGIFGRIGKRGVVADLKVEAADLEVGGYQVGILAGDNAGRVINCQVRGRLSGGKIVVTPSDAGALVGRNRGDILYCRANTEFVRGYESAGGLVGYNEIAGRIVGCYAACKHVYAWKYNAGGLVGTNDGYIGGCYATGEVLGWDFSYNYGGLVGNSYGTILNCHSDSSITTDRQSVRLGGLVGVAEGTIANCCATGSINTRERCGSIGGLIGDNGAYVVNSYASGRISAGANSKQVGGLVGDNVRGDVRMCFWDIDASGTRESAAGTGLNTFLMQRAGTFLEVGWDFVDERVNGTTDAWRMPEGAGYPVLTLELDGYNGPELAGKGTADAPYRIGTPQDLGAVWRHDPSACYELTSHIDLSGIRWAGAPIAAFNGTLNGAGFVISHLTLQVQRTAGLFGNLYPNAIVMNLGMADANVVGGHHARNLGLLVGSNYGGSVTRCYATGRLSGGRQSFALGGLIGSNQGSITDCYASTNVSCDEKSSGIGGLLGVTSGSVERSYASGAIAVPDPNGACGGFIGVSWKATVGNCYFLALSDGGGPDNNLGSPLTNVEMKQRASFSGWDFEQIWIINEGKDYPHLRGGNAGNRGQARMAVPQGIWGQTFP
jgi:hypothetical protein